MDRCDIGVVAVIIFSFAVGGITGYIASMNNNESIKETNNNHNISINVSLSEGTVRFIHDIVAELKLPPKVEPKKLEYEIHPIKLDGNTVPCKISNGKPPIISEPDHIVLEGNESSGQSLPPSSESVSAPLPQKVPPASVRSNAPASGKRPRSRNKR